MNSQMEHKRDLVGSDYKSKMKMCKFYNNNDNNRINFIFIYLQKHLLVLLIDSV